MSNLLASLRALQTNCAENAMEESQREQIGCEMWQRARKRPKKESKEPTATFDKLIEFNDKTVKETLNMSTGDRQTFEIIIHE